MNNMLKSDPKSVLSTRLQKLVQHVSYKGSWVPYIVEYELVFAMILFM